MTTRRHPIRPTSKLRIMPEAIAAFRQMESARVRCTCPPVDTRRAGRCKACDEWWTAHAVLHDALGLPPWLFPCISRQCERDARRKSAELYLALVEAAK